MSSTGRKSADRPKRLFLGNQLALDFVNTRPLQGDQLVELLPDFAALLHWFHAAGLLEARQVTALRRKWAGSPRAQRAATAMRRFRENLRKEVLAWEHGGSVRRSLQDELNKLMADHPMRTRLRANGKSFSKELWFPACVPEDLFAPLAYSGAALFADLDRKRVRKCPTCVLHFFDTSKKGTRRWCSMELCGNRLKVAAYAARRRKFTDR